MLEWLYNMKMSAKFEMIFRKRKFVVVFLQTRKFTLKFLEFEEFSGLLIMSMNEWLANSQNCQKKRKVASFLLIIHEKVYQLSMLVIFLRMCFRRYEFSLMQKTKTLKMCLLVNKSCIRNKNHALGLNSSIRQNDREEKRSFDRSKYVTFSILLPRFRLQ